MPRRLAKFGGHERVSRGAAGAAPAAVRQVLREPGRGLDAEARRFLEPRFGHDFSRVRVHTGDRAATSADSVSAKAYTVGPHIVFNHREYEPHSQPGRELIARELTHSLQQNQSANADGDLALDESKGASEREAAHAGPAAAQGTDVAVESSHAAGVQRQPLEAPPHADLAESASPLLASAIGSVTVDSFDTGKSEISAGNRSELARTARTIQTLLMKYPGSTVRVIGHTDAIGKEENNQVLGQSRADAVQAALIDMGVPPAAIQTESHGETDLLIKTQKPEPRNRRVQVKFEVQGHRFAGVLPDTSLRPPGSPSSAPSFETPKPTVPPPYKYQPKDDLDPSLPSWFWKPLPPGPATGGTSLDDAIGAAAKKITSFLPKPVQEKAQDLVKSAIEKGVTAGLDAALQAAGVDEKSRQAIGKAAEAAIKQKLGGTK